MVITAFVLAAEILEGLTVGRGRRAIQDMLDFLPQVASVLREGQIVDVPTQTILPGEIVVIRPGSRIPVDGQVVSGHSFVEEAAITGEPMPSEKTAGKEVFAGTINQAGSLQVRADRLGKETTFGKIIEAVEKAEHSRAPIQKMADRLAGYLVYFALGAAVLTFLITHNIRSTISVIIVAGACGIAAGTPLAILGAIGRAARHGSIIKGGIYLEALGQLNTVFLDKTGTLTFGMPLVTEVNPAPGVNVSLLLEVAASAESSSEHPLGRAIVRFTEQKNIPVSQPAHFEYRIGRGVLADVYGEETVAGNRALFAELGLTLPERAAAEGTEIFVARNGQYIGSVVVADQLRPGSASAVKALQVMKIDVILLTGDTRQTAQGVASNPVRRTRIPRRGPVEEKSPIETGTVKGLIEKLAEPSRSIAALLARTGLRIGELLALRWQDIDLQQGLLSVNQTVYEGHFDEPKTKRSKRRIPLGPQCVEILAALKRTEATPSTLVFSARNGSPLSRRNLLNRQLKPAAKALKLTGVNWHWFRHAHATLLDSTGTPIGTTQALLGHLSSEITSGT